MVKEIGFARIVSSVKEFKGVISRGGTQCRRVQKAGRVPVV